MPKHSRDDFLASLPEGCKERNRAVGAEASCHGSQWPEPESVRRAAIPPFGDLLKRPFEICGDHRRAGATWPRWRRTNAISPRARGRSVEDRRVVLHLTQPLIRRVPQFPVVAPAAEFDFADQSRLSCAPSPNPNASCRQRRYATDRAEAGQRQLECFHSQPESASYPEFNRWMYSMDVLLPVPEVGQKQCWSQIIRSQRARSR